MCGKIYHGCLFVFAFFFFVLDSAVIERGFDMGGQISTDTLCLAGLGVCSFNIGQISHNGIMPLDA